VRIRTRDSSRTTLSGAGLRVCVVGCGAVGSLFAANLAQLDDVEVWAYDLAREHVDAINREGLRLTGAGEVVGRPRATADPGELPPCDFGIVATKAMHTDSAIAATAGAFAGGSVATVQNGLGNEEVLARHVERVIRGTTFPAGKLLAPGRVQWDVKGETTLGPFEPRPAPLAEVERLADACTRAGMPAHAVADARGPQWRKVIFNASTNPVGALTGLTHGRVCEDPALRRLVSGLVDEGKEVAVAQGIELDADPEELIDHAAKPEVAYDHKASMLQDVEARRPTEIDYLNGGIVRFGHDHGVATPLNAAIWALVKGLEASWQRT
jgi:2-dehydropantoate 2-reductase